jgi:DNA primase
MAGRIPEDIIDKVRDAVAIEEVIGHFVPLQRKGASYWGRCPFHQEKTPSFHVHPERQIFYCFGCQRGGGVFRFLMDKEGMDFPEAVQWCASRVGLDLERFLVDDRQGPDPRGPLLEANAWYAGWVAEQLHSPAGEACRAYARGRGLRPETLEAFGLGFAPADGRAVVQSAEKANISLESLLRASILGRKEGRAPFAYFR